MQTLSVSQVGAFDPEQYGGCERRWWFEYPQGLAAESTDAKNDGTAGHALIEHYLKTGERPKGRVKMGKMVNAAIMNGRLPEPGPDLEIERRITGQPRYDAAGAYVPLDPRLTPLWAAGIPFDGYIDIAHWRDIPTVIDVKFSSDINSPEKLNLNLMRTIQLPGYGRTLLHRWGGDRVRLGHLYISRHGTESRLTPPLVVTRQQIDDRWGEVEETVKRMLAVEPAADQDAVPFNRKSCRAWMGCPHQSMCNAFKEKKVSLSADELALFDGLDAPTTPTDAPPPPEQPAPVPAAKPLIMPACAACGADLNPENSSTLQSGALKHVGCPAAAAPVPAEDIIASKKTRARAAKLEAIAPVAPTPVAPAVEPKTPREVVRETLQTPEGKAVVQSVAAALSRPAAIPVLRIEVALSADTLAVLRALIK